MAMVCAGAVKYGFPAPSVYYSIPYADSTCAYKHSSWIAECDEWEYVAIGARDFSPEIIVRLIGTEVPCSDKVFPTPKFQF